MKHSAITLLKKVLVYCAGLFIMAMGVSFSGPPIWGCRR